MSETVPLLLVDHEVLFSIVPFVLTVTIILLFSLIIKQFLLMRRLEFLISVMKSCSATHELYYRKVDLSKNPAQVR